MPRRHTAAVRLIRARRVDPVAYDLFLRGRYYARRRETGDIARGIALLDQAVAGDSTFADAWAAIAGTLSSAHYWHMPVPGVAPDSIVARELQASDRALMNDSNSAEIWVARAAVLANVDPTSRAAPIRLYRCALALDSLDASAWNGLGFSLEEAGSDTAAVAAMRRAAAIAPGTVGPLVTLGLHYWWLRQNDSAAIWSDSALAMDPTYFDALALAGSVALARGRLNEAEAHFRAATRIGPCPERIWPVAGLAALATARGDRERTQTFAVELEGLTDPRSPTLHGAVFLAWTYAALGVTATAMDWLERYQPSADLHFQLHLIRDGQLDPLRGSARFKALLALRTTPARR